MSSFSFFSFILLTILYFILLYFLDRKLHTALNIIYYCFVIVSQLFITYQQSKELCKTPNIGSVLLWSLIPWFIIFIGLNALLTMFPGWKAPFSNTFGYLVVRILGIKNTFNSLLKSNYTTQDAGLNKVMEQIYEDESLLINEIIPTNFDTAIEKLKPLFDTKNRERYNESIVSLRKMVLLKDEVSRFIWYVLTGGFVISLSSMGIASTKCTKTSKQLQEEQEKYKSVLAQHREMDEEKNASKKLYYVRD